jgi:hypothetical protein
LKPVEFRLENLEPFAKLSQVELNSKGNTCIQLEGNHRKDDYKVTDIAGVS